MFGPLPAGESAHDFVFPDWSPYTELDKAVQAYFRDPEIALEALSGSLGDRPVLGFTLERVVSDDGMVWQEAVVCDGHRIVLWHGEDVPADEETGAPEGAMTSAVRTIPLSRVSEVGYRRLLVRPEVGGEATLHGVDAYILLESMDEARMVDRDADQATVFAHDSIRLGKSIEAAGLGQCQRLMDFAQLVAGLTGLPNR